jgi:putative ubiquitin-RnfH superfamily antitoxin RatB of RatAB toxin-antitoxin module
MINVEVAYALPERQWLASVELADGGCVREAVDAAMAAGKVPLLDRTDLTLGVWGKKAAPDRVLADGERVEIYRPLEADPKEVRRALAAVGKTMGAKGGRSGVNGEG